MSFFGCGFSARLRAIVLLALACLAASIDAQLANSGWPKAYGNQFNSGVSTGGNAVPSIKWSVPCDGMNPVIGINGEVYLTKPTGELLYALDPATGANLWTFDAGPNFAVSGACVGEDGTVYVGLTGLDFQGSTQGGLYALNGATGKIVWSNTSAGFLSPTIGGPNFFLYSFSITPNSDGNLHFMLNAFNPTSGAIVWNLPDVSEYGAEISAIASDGSLYVSAEVLISGGLGHDVLSIDGNTGSLNWTAGYYCFTDIVVGPTGILYFMTNNMGSGHPDGLIALNSKGGLLWDLPLGYVSLPGPVVRPDGIVYWHPTTGGVGAFDATTGASLWTLPFSQTDLGISLIDANGVLYATQQNNLPSGVGGYIHAINTVTGQSAWSLALGANLPTGTMAMAANGTLYFGNGTTVVAIDSAYATSLSVNPTTVVGGQSVAATVTLSTAAPPGGAIVKVASNSTGVVAPFSIQIPQGQTTANFSVVTNPVVAQTTVTLTATPGNVTTTMTVNPPSLIGVGLNPTTVVGGNPSTGTVTISSAAPSSGMSVAISSSLNSVVVPNSVTIPAGKTSQTFSVSTTGVDSQSVATITATFTTTTQTATLTVKPASLASVSLSPTSVQGGNASTGNVSLDGFAGPNGVSIGLASGNVAATVPSSVGIAAGKSSATFKATTVGVNYLTNAVITATLNNLPQSATLAITPATVSSLSLNPPSIQGGSSSTGTVTLSGPAGAGGTTIALSTGNVAATVPSSVVVSAGQTTATFGISTTGVNTQTAVTISATLNGQTTQSILTVNPATLSSLGLNPTSVPGGTPSTATITLSGPAAPGGTTVTLTSASVAATVPGSVTIAAGQSTTTFPVKTAGVDTQTAAKISANLANNSQSATLTITAASPVSLTLSPSTVIGGANSSAQVTLNALAGPSGLVVTLSSSSGSATVPSSTVVPFGHSSGTFTVNTSAVSSTVNATISASANGATAQAGLTIGAAALALLTLNPTTVAGVATSTGTVTLSGPAGSQGAVVSIASSNGSAMVPSSVTISAGQISASFSVSTKAVTTQTSATITAKLGSVTKSATLTMSPISVASLSFNPNSLTGGATSVGTATLNGIAPKGGLVVKLVSGATTVKVPTTVTVLAGAASATFKATTVAVSMAKAVSVTATLGAVSQTATITVNPPVLVSLSLTPASVKGGASSSGTLTLSAVAPTGGIAVKLTSSLTSATVPATVTIPAGSLTAKFTVSTKKVTGNVKATIAATSLGVSKTATLALTP